MPYLEIERITPQTEAKELQSLDVMKMQTPADGQKMIEWLTAGEHGFDAVQTKVILENMAANWNNSIEGWPRSYALIASRIFFTEGHVGAKKDRREIYGQLKQKLGDQADQILGEGYEDKQSWLQTERKEKSFDVDSEENPLQTDLAGTVDEVVTEFLAERKTPEAATEPDAPVWGEEQRAAAEKFYNDKELKEPEQKKLDGLARAILDSGLDPEIIEVVINSLPETRKLMDVSGRKEDVDWIIAMQTPGINGSGKNQILDALKPVLLLKKLPNESARLKAVDANWKFYDGLVDALRWRLEKLGEEKEVRDRITKEAEKLTFRLGEMGTAGIIEVDLAVKNLITEAAGSGIVLPARALGLNVREEAGSVLIGGISVELNQGWNSGNCEFEYKPFRDDARDMLTGVVTMIKLDRLKLDGGYELKKIDEKFILFKDMELVSEVDVKERGLVRIGWVGEVNNGLEAMAVLGQGFNDFINSEERFPALVLELKEPEAAAATEPARSNLVGEETAPATEETSGPGLEATATPPDAAEEAGEQRSQSVNDFLASLSKEPSAEEESGGGKSS